MFFQKTNCVSCGRRVNKTHRYCPFCGNNLKTGERNSENYADDFQEFSNIKLPFPFGKIFEQLTKEMAKEIDKLSDEDFSENKIINSGGVDIRISNKGGIPTIRIGGPAKSKNRAILRRVVSEEEAERYSRLPREEAKANVKRLSNGVVYEIELPDVKNIKDVFVTRLQNSIEVKAFGKERAYSKVIPVDMDVRRYALRNGKLTLELKE